MWEFTVRSSKPLDAIGIQWQYPLWKHAPTLDVTALKKPNKSAKPAAIAVEAPDEPARVCDHRRRGEVCVRRAPHIGLDRGASPPIGFGNMSEVRRLVRVAAESRLIFPWPNKDRRSPQRFASREPLLTDLASQKESQS